MASKNGIHKKPIHGHFNGGKSGKMWENDDKPFKLRGSLFADKHKSMREGS
jgi:hypothetical protein